MTSVALASGRIKKEMVMKTSLRVWCLCLLGAAVLLNGCAGKYDDAQKLNVKFVDSMEEYIAELEQADSAREVAGAMNRYADRMEKLWPKMRAQSEKYPELQKPGTIPEELKRDEARATEVGIKMANSFQKILPFMGEPEVVKAQERIGMAMTGK